MHSTTEEIRELYESHDAAAHANEDWYGILVNGFREHADRFAHVMGIIKDLQPSSILDIACSRGIFGALVRWQRGYAPDIVDGVDLSAPAVTFCRFYDRVLMHNVCEPFDMKRQYDLVLVQEILEHVPDPVAVLNNAVRHMGKRMLISTPVEDGEVDGVIHVRHVTHQDHLDWLALAGATHLSHKITQHHLPSRFCEEHWQGWNYTLVEVV